MVEQFILSKRGDDFMKDLDDVRDIAKRVNGKRSGKTVQEPI